MKPLAAGDIRGTWAAVLAAWDADDALSTARIAAQIDTLIAAGVDGIYCNGTAGEFHVQTEDEFDAIAGLLADRCTAAGMPFQVGASHPTPQVSLARVRRAAALAPGAIQVILPDWLPVSDDEAADFLAGAAAAAGGIGLVLYNPPHAKRVLSPAAVGRLAGRVPALVGLKTGAGDEDWYRAAATHLAAISVFVPGHHLATGIARGADGSYSNVACLNPAAARRWHEQARADPPAARALEARLQDFMAEHISPFITEQGYCTAACDRLLAMIGNWADVGDRMRWPYRAIPAAEADRLRPVARDILPEFFP